MTTEVKTNDECSHTNTELVDVDMSYPDLVNGEPDLREVWQEMEHCKDCDAYRLPGDEEWEHDEQ